VRGSDRARDRIYDEDDMLMPTPTLTKLVQRIRAEFDETPGLEITVDEGVRFWALDAEACEHVLTRLHETGFLLKTHDGHYRRRRTV
jgi:hypothetical protein